MGPRISDVFLDGSGASTSTGLLFDMSSAPGSFELKHKSSVGFLLVVLLFSDTRHTGLVPVSSQYKRFLFLLNFGFAF
jgi:hypothetical protein